MFGLVEHVQRLGPLLSPHVNHAEICISSASLRIHFQDLAKILFRFVEAAAIESILARLKKLWDVLGRSLRRSHGRAVSRVSWRRRRRTLWRNCRCHASQ